MKMMIGSQAEPGPLQRFADQIEPRVKADRQTCVPSVGAIRGRGMRRWAPA
jgi:hypothetical protein